MDQGACFMDREISSIIEVSAPGAPSDLVFNVTQQLITELNREIGPVASRVAEKAASGTKGDLVSLGQIALALISAGITKQIAEILVHYIRRNPRYVIQVGKIKITKDHASKDDVTLINALVQELAAKKNKRS
jgi:hypothetical protein